MRTRYASHQPKSLPPAQNGPASRSGPSTLTFRRSWTGHDCKVWYFWEKTSRHTYASWTLFWNESGRSPLLPLGRKVIRKGSRGTLACLLLIKILMRIPCLGAVGWVPRDPVSGSRSRAFASVTSSKIQYFQLGFANKIQHFPLRFCHKL